MWILKRTTYLLFILIFAFFTSFFYLTIAFPALIFSRLCEKDIIDAWFGIADKIETWSMSKTLKQ